MRPLRAESAAPWMLSPEEKRYREARRHPTALELQRPLPRQRLLATQACLELTKQLADEDPTITKLADQGIFIWPETEFNGVGMHLKMEHGRSFEAKARVGLSEEGIDRIFMEWKDSGTTVELVLPDSGSAPPQALLFCLDAIAETELAIERSSRVYTGVHYLNLTRDPAHRTYY